MKKMFVLGGVLVVLAFCLGFTACDIEEKGGDLKLTNSTGITEYFVIRFNGVDQRVNNGSYKLDPGMTVNANSKEDVSYAVFPCTGDNAIVKGTEALWWGKIEKGKTITHDFKDAPAH